MIKKRGGQTTIEFGTGDINIIPGILIQEKIGNVYDNPELLEEGE